MLDHYAAYLYAQRSTRNLASSALPWAPVVVDGRPAPRRRVRAGAALALHRLADRLQSS
jgi:hypothetical protein